jgi:hypothetical protein
MRLRNPRHRYECVKTRVRLPTDDLERTLFVILHGADELNKISPQRPWGADQVVDPSVRYPHNVFNSETTRMILEAFLISTDSDADIGDALGMNIDEVHAYRHLFFDTDCFRTDLDLIAYMRSIPEESEYKGMFKVAFHQGFHALRWQFCRDKGRVEPEDVIRTIMTDTFFRSLEHRGMSLTSKAAKEATKLATTALQAARILTGDEPPADSDLQGLKMKFEQVRENRTVQDLQKSGVEVIH